MASERREGVVETMKVVETRMAEGWMTSEGWTSAGCQLETDQQRTQVAHSPVVKDRWLEV